MRVYLRYDCSYEIQEYQTPKEYERIEIANGKVKKTVPITLFFSYYKTVTHSQIHLCLKITSSL